MGGGGGGYHGGGVGGGGGAQDARRRTIYGLGLRAPRILKVGRNPERMIVALNPQSLLRSCSFTRQRSKSNRTKGT